MNELLQPGRKVNGLPCQNSRIATWFILLLNKENRWGWKVFRHFWGIGHFYLTETTLHSSLLCRESTYPFSHYSTYPFCFEIFWTIFLIRRIQSRRSRGVKCWEPLSATSIQTVNWMSTWISAGMFDKVEFPLFSLPHFLHFLSLQHSFSRNGTTQTWK